MSDSREGATSSISSSPSTSSNTWVCLSVTPTPSCSSDVSWLCSGVTASKPSPSESLPSFSSFSIVGISKPDSCMLELLTKRKYFRFLLYQNKKKKKKDRKSHLPYSSTSIPSTSLIGSSNALSFLKGLREELLILEDMLLRESSSRIW